MILGLTSDIIKLPQIYDAADSILSQKLAQIEGVGQVFVGGGAQPAVRAELNPTLLNKLGVGLDTVRTALGNANANAAERFDRWSSQLLDSGRQRPDLYRRPVPPA